MKKWLIWCLTVLAMVCLIPGIVLNVKAADSIYTYCFVCMQQRNYEILGYTKVDSTKHRIHIKCSVCGRKNSIVYGDLSDHTGGTETPPAPQAKPVKNAARNTAFSVTNGKLRRTLPWQRHAPHHLLALRLKWYRKLYRWHSNLHHQSGL